MTRRRVAVVTPFFPWEGDTVTGSFVLDHAQALLDLGHEISVFAPVPSAPWPLSISSRFASYARTPRRQTLDRGNLSLSVQRPRYLRPPGRWFRAHAGRSMARGLRLQGFDAVIAHTLLPGGAAALRAVDGSVPVLTVVHGSDVFQHATESASTRRVAEDVAERSATVVAVSDALAEAVRRLGGRAPVETVANGVDTERFVPWSADQQAEQRRVRGVGDGPVLLFVGLDAHRKGLDLLLSAHRQLRASGSAHRLVIVGAQGTEEPGVLWLGRRSREELPDWTALSDVAVLPSREEAFGISLLEAASCEVPAVGTSVQGIREVLVDGVTGRLVPPEDPTTLAQVLGELLDDADERQRLGRAARVHVREHFSWRAHAVRMNEILEAVLDERA